MYTPSIKSIVDNVYIMYKVHCTLGKPVFESFSISVTVGHKCHNKHIWKVSSQNM